MATRWKEMWRRMIMMRRDGDGLVVSVAEEKAVDSYNESFECDLHMTRKQVEQLRDWLLVEFPK